jgi:hypothetical protein
MIYDNTKQKTDNKKHRIRVFIMKVSPSTPHFMAAVDCLLFHNSMKNLQIKIKIEFKSS